jgi:hypothetical protein
LRLDDLLGKFQALRFPARNERTHPDRALIVAARSSVERAVIDDEFLADCIALELRRIERNRAHRGLVPFFTMRDLGIRFAFGYWAPGDTARAHEHTAWTITAVCRNALEVLTYDRDESYRKQELVPKNRFHAPAGRVGFIFEPCIHNPRNVSADWSLSFHIISPRDGERPDDYRGLLPALESSRGLSSAADGHPYASVIAARRRNRCVHQLARIVGAMRVRQASDLLDRCFALGSTATQSFIDLLAPKSQPKRAFGMRQMLVRTNEDLIIRHRYDGDMVALYVETPKGPVQEFAIDEAAREAMAFVARESLFELRAIPGNLSDDERAAIGEALEETGLFTRITPGRGAIGTMTVEGGSDKAFWEIWPNICQSDRAPTATAPANLTRDDALQTRGDLVPTAGARDVSGAAEKTCPIENRTHERTDR